MNVRGLVMNPDFRADNLQEWIDANLKYSSDEIGENEA